MIDRRHLLRAGGAAALGIGLARPGRPAPARAFSSQLPPDMGQTDLTVYVPATGHTLRGSMLDYWRANGAAAVYGNPISEPFDAANGYYSQAFERAVFQYRPEFQDTADPIIRLLPVGQTALAATIAATGGDLLTDRLSKALAEASKPVDPNGKRVADVAAIGGRLVDGAGHTLSGELLKWYDRHEGGFYLGNPLTEPVDDGAGLLQYFDGGVLYEDRDGNVRLLSIVPRMAAGLKIDTTPVPRGDLPVFDEALFATADNPSPAGDESTPGRKWIEVSLSEQQLWAYQGIATVLGTLVSTGLDPNVTNPGTFHIRLKFPSQTMTGFTGSTGEVVGFGDTAPADDPNATAFNVPDVPNVMYFNLDPEALHGTYWHNNFGNPMSHGCVNLPLDVAAWMYGWAPLGTMVWIHE